MTYEIRANQEFNSQEIYFAGKPSAETRNALKGLRFRWHSVKKCWYGHADADAIRAAIDGTEAPQEAQKAGTPQNRIRIYWNGFKLDGDKKLTCKVRYSRPDAETGAINIYADGYGDDIPQDLFDVRNGTDIYTDYFDKDRATVTADHPLYKYIRYAALKYWSRGKWARDVDKAAFDAATDPGQPTVEDLQKIDQARQEAENARRAAEHKAELQEREKMLKQRHDGRVYIEKVMEAYPIEDGAPVVEITFSENPAFFSWTKSVETTSTKVVIHADGTQDETTEILNPKRRCILSVKAADIVLDHFDKVKHICHDGYDKTDFVIAWTDADGDPWRYEGRYDLGDLDGGLVAHIRELAKWDQHHDQFGHETDDPQKISTARLEWVELLESYLATAE